jgi:hypothetical protein
MPPANPPRTLRDLHNHATAMPPAAEEDYAGGTASDNNNNNNLVGLRSVHHIPTLPEAAQARQMLDRVVKEFAPIASRRGYRVTSVSELCCCHDGLDFRETTTGKRSRKLRKVSANIWGYNRTTQHGGGRPSVHSIHLRLRHAQQHGRFLAYEDVAGTLAHELAHCEHGPHNANFYKLMDSILDEHASLMAAAHTTRGFGSAVDEASTVTAFGGTGQRLDGSTSKTDGAMTTTAPPRGYTLGGDTNFTQWMTPREAAVAAALARQRQQHLRLRGNSCCRPCIVTDDADDEGAVIDVDATVPPVAARSKRRPTATIDEENQKPRKVNARAAKKGTTVIDLTSDNEDDKPTRKPAAKPSSRAPWSCRACTFLNPPSRATTACEVCQTPCA